MKLFSALAAAAIAVTGALAPAAEAHHLGYRHEYNAANWVHLADTIEEHGVQIWLDAKYCDENDGLLGMAIKGTDNSMHMLICRDNHNDNYNEMADTFRHEVVHLIQYCKGERMGATPQRCIPSKVKKASALHVTTCTCPWVPTTRRSGSTKRKPGSWPSCWTNERSPASSPTSAPIVAVPAPDVTD